MKKFDFKLQPLLKYRQYLERIAQQNTASAHMDVKNSEKQIEELKKTYGHQTLEIQKAAASGISGRDFQQYHQYLDAVEHSIEEEGQRKQELIKILNKKLQELRKKSVDKKVMELYRDKLKHAYTQEMVKNEQKELDEITTLKTARACSQ